MDKDKFEASMKLAEFGATRWDRRREYEWKISFGLWALLAYAISVPIRFDALPDWLGGAIIVGYALLWQRNIFLANHADKSLSDAYRRHAQRILDLPYEPPRAWRLIELMTSRWWLRRSIAFLFDWAAFFQILFTSLLVILVYERCQKEPARPLFGWSALDWL